MFKKILTIIAVILTIVIIGLFVWAFLVSRKSGGEVTVTESFRELVSFGNGSGNIFTQRGIRPSDIDFLGIGDLQDDIDISLQTLRKIAAFEVAGATIIKNEKEDTLARFIARENGHIFEIPVDSATQKRISNTTILRIRDVIWLSNGMEFVAQFLDESGSDIESFYASIGFEDTADIATLQGSFLQKNIMEIVPSNYEDKIFYLVDGGSEAIGIISDFDGSKKAQIFNSPLLGWIAQWADKDTIALTTKAYSNTQGYLYFLDTDTGELEKIISREGLTTLVSKDAKQVLFTYNDINRLLLGVHTVDSGESIDLPIWTLSEKCVWSSINYNIVYCGVPNTVPSGDDLDTWYKGLTSFSDSIWMIDTETQTASVLSEPINIVGEEIDLIKPVLSPDEDYLLFINKRDSNLWQLKIN